MKGAVKIDFILMAEDDVSTYGEYFEDTNKIRVRILK